ncbi:WGxxGxxG family protein [Sphingomonas sp.]|uniref:WGxxGxxG family protein n=1 Tax=Sphingomonas sp. TaxID=28214 RepID=UPI00286D0C0B|nr:WGxxGxxG family protein [Sphingomonas sp.]
MRTKLMVAALLMVSATSTPALAQKAQDKGGIPTETQQRMAHQDDPLPWDLLGLFGLIGLFGLRTSHPDDSYHPSNLD